jgi:hypothetical protein
MLFNTLATAMLYKRQDENGIGKSKIYQQALCDSNQAEEKLQRDKQLSFADMDPLLCAYNAEMAVNEALHYKQGFADGIRFILDSLMYDPTQE